MVARMSEEKEIIIDKAGTVNYEYVVKKDTRFDIVNLEQQLKRLQQENEELKKKVKDLDAMTGIFSARLATKYRQALEEIKEIAKHCMKQDVCTLCEYNNKCDLRDEEIPTYDNNKLILDKINEALNENS